MFYSLIIYIFGGVLCACAEWVEIPQFSNRKSYLGVTPYNPYIYDHTMLFTPTTTETYDTILIPTIDHKFYSEQKKSITKFPDYYMQHIGLTTDMTQIPLKHKPNNITKVNRKKNQNKHFNEKPKKSKKPKTTSTTTTTTTTTTPKPKPIEKILINEKRFDEGVVEDDEEYYDDEYEDEGVEVEANDNDRHVHEGEILMSEKEYYDDTEYDEEDYEDDDGDDDEEENESLGHSYIGFLPYLKNIQSTLIRTSHKSTDDKVSFLTEIKNRLLYAIKQKIASYWPSFNKRSTRSTQHDYFTPWAKKSERGMDFPSNEGALLTLGFLTFAVFLVKCILRLIYSVKGKHKHPQHHHVWPYPGFTLPTLPTFTLPTIPALPGRRKRAINEKTVEIMDFIDKFKYR